jgi:hypothetical protein
MQLYLAGTNPLYWQQISELPEGIYNRGNNQTSSATIDQLFTAFVDLPLGTLLDIYMSVDGGNLRKMATAAIIDNTGFLYARFPIPFSRSLDTIEFTIKENGPNFSPKDKTVASEGFSSGHIAYMFEVQAKAAYQALIDATQLEQNLTILGVEDQLLGSKFGTFTGLSRRADQPVKQYRLQTACLWNAFQFSGTEKGVADAIGCVIGDFDGTLSQISITPSRAVRLNQVFDFPQFGPTGIIPGFFTDGATGTRWDGDLPHFYIPDIGPSGRDFYVDANTDDPDIPTLAVLGPFPGEQTEDKWDVDTVRVFTIPSTNALGNESIVEISSTIALGMPEEAAVATVTAEDVLRRNPPVTTPPTLVWGTDNPDFLANGYVASTVNVTSCIIDGLQKTDEVDLPKEDTDFTVTHLDGKIVWGDPATGKVPDTGTVYTTNYKFRLDRQLKIVLSKIKPAHRSIVILFSRVVSGLPRAVEI